MFSNLFIPTYKIDPIWRNPLLYLFLIISNEIIAQQLFVQQYPAEVFRAAGQTWYVDQDRDGNLYFANNDGVLKYDGRDWNLISLPNKDFILSLGLDSHDNIFVSANNEMGYLQKDSLGKYQYTSLLSKLPAPYKDVKIVDQVAVFNDIAFFKSDDYIYKYENEKFEVIKAVNSGLYKMQGKLYLITEQGLQVFNSDNFEPASFNFKLNGLTIKWLTDDNKGYLFIVDDKNKIWKLNTLPISNEKISLLSVGLQSYLKNRKIIRLKSLSTGNLAILLEDELFITSNVGEILYSFKKDLFIGNFTFRIFYEDQHHNLWLASNSFITQIITSLPLGFYDEHNGLNGVILSLGKKNKHLYVGTTNGIFAKKDKSTFSMVPRTDGEAWNFYNFNNELYVSHSSGVFILQEKKVKRIISHDYVHSLCEVYNHAGSLLMGTFNTGIWLLNKKGDQWSKTKIKGFEEETRFIQQDEDGNVWISHYNKGIFKIQLNEAMDSVLTKSFYDQHNGLPSNINNRIYRLKDNTIVVTTMKGFFQYNKTKDRFEPILKYNKALGTDICIYTFQEDDHGDIYFWGALEQQKEFGGVLKKDSVGNYTLFTKPFSKTAIPIREVRVDVDAPLLQANNEEILIGNNLRLLTLNPKQKSFFNESFKTRITHVWTGRTDVIHDTEYKFTQNNNLRFEFISSFLENSEKTEYQFKIKGFQNEWSDWTLVPEASFTNLPPGKYTFSVRAKNLYNTITQPTSFSFYIPAPWYNAWWVYVLYVIMGILTMYLLIKLNTVRIRKQKIVLERKVMEKNHEIVQQALILKELNSTKDKLFSVISHDLRGPLNQIQQVLGLLELNYVSEEEFKNLVPGFQESVRNTLDLTENLLYWAKSQMKGFQVVPSMFNLYDATNENISLFRPFADKKNIILINQVSSDVIIYGDKDMIRTVIRNLLNNAIKFSDIGSEVVVGSETEKKLVTVFVKDTGRGLSIEEKNKILSRQSFSTVGTRMEKGTGLGLILCQEFIEKNNGFFLVESILGKGSKFIFKIPLPDN